MPLDSPVPPDTATLKVNARGLVRALRDSFSGHSNVVKELMQNARRAGSPNVAITYNEKTKYLEVVDEGGGISDFQKLLEIASSGWDAETIERESCYGIGFMSALYSAERIEVESNGKRLAANTADVLAFKPASIKECKTVKTRIALLGLTRDLDDCRFDQLADGFPLPVSYNGRALKRTMADGPSFADCEVGRVRLAAKPTMAWVAYLQGFKIAESRCYSGYSRDNATVFHLDPKTFIGRMPDREQLTNLDEATAKIEACVGRLLTAHFLALKQAGDHKALLSNLKLLGEIDAKWLLNDIPVLPAGAIEPFEYTDMTYSDFGLHDRFAEDLTQEQSGKTVLVLEGAFDEDGVLEEYLGNIGERDERCAEPFNILQYLAALNGFKISPTVLDAGHWVYKLPNLVREFKGKVKVKPTGNPVSFGANGHCFGDDFVVCDAIEFDGPLGKAKVEEGFALIKGKKRGDDMVVAHNTGRKEIVAQYSSFTDGNDHYMEDWFEEDAASIDAEIRAARNKNPVVFLEEALGKFRYGSMRSKVAGKSFTVRFAKDGSPKVELVKRAAKGVANVKVRK